jgi:O-methyltransferase involved in polyketide biosynthesis
VIEMLSRLVIMYGLSSAVRQGVSQLIVLGAGLDTFAYRQPE